MDAHFTAPRSNPGDYRLDVTVNSSIGRDEITQTIQLADAVQVMLSADKPLYQPGQTMHLRALALEQATHGAVEQRDAHLRSGRCTWE